MKTKISRISKRSLAMILGVLMLVSSMGLGSLITANAWAAAYSSKDYYNVSMQIADDDSGNWSETFHSFAFNSSGICMIYMKNNYGYEFVIYSDNNKYWKDYNGGSTVQNHNQHATNSYNATIEYASGSNSNMKVTPTGGTGWYIIELTSIRNDTSNWGWGDSYPGDLDWKFYKATTYTVSYNKGSNGTGDNASDTKTKDKTLTLRNAIFTRTGYTQTAWNTNSSGTGGTSYALGGSYTGNAALTLYPTWTAETYTVTLNKNSGTINAGNVTSYTYGTGATLPTNVTRSGYRFDGWYDNEELDGSRVTTISNTATGNKTYWAKWTAVYGVTTNGGSYGTLSAAPSSVGNGESVTLTAAVTNSAYNFDGVDITKTSDSSAITSIAASSFSGTTSGGTYSYTMPGAYGITATSKYVEKSFDITVANDQNENTSTVTGHPITTSSIIVPSVSGYHIVNWTVTNGSVTVGNTTYISGQTISTAGNLTNVTVTAAATVRANMEETLAVTHDLTLPSGEGISSVTVNGEEESGTVEIEENTPVTVVVTFADGYTYASWTSTGASVTKDSITTYTLSMTADTTLTVSTQKISHAISVNGVNCTVTPSANSGVGDDVITLTVTPHTGYAISSVVATWQENPLVEVEIDDSNGYKITVPYNTSGGAINVTATATAITPTLNVNYYTATSTTTDKSTGSGTTSSRTTTTISLANKGVYPSDATVKFYNGDTLLNTTTAATGSYAAALPAGNYTALKVKVTLDDEDYVSATTVSLTVNQSRTLTVNVPANSSISAGSYTDEFGVAKSISAAGTYYAKNSTAYSVTYTANTDYKITSTNPATGTITDNTTITPTVAAIDYLYFYAAIPTNWSKNIYAFVGASQGAATAPTLVTAYSSTYKTEYLYSRGSGGTQWTSGTGDGCKTYRVRLYKIDKDDATGKHVYLSDYADKSDVCKDVGTINTSDNGYLYLLYTKTDGSGNTTATLNPQTVSATVSDTGNVGTSGGKNIYNTTGSLTLNVPRTNFYKTYTSAGQNAQYTAGGDTVDITYQVKKASDNSVVYTTSGTYTSGTPTLNLATIASQPAFVDGALYYVTVTTADASTGKITHSADTGQFYIEAQHTVTTSGVLQADHSVAVPGAIASESVTAGSTVNTMIVQATDVVGYTFNGWAKSSDAITLSGEITAGETHSVTVAATATGTVYAEYTRNGYSVNYTANAAYTFTPDGWTNGGTVLYGDTVSFDVTPASGAGYRYVIDSVTATSASGSVAVANDGTTYSFTMPGSAVTITVTSHREWLVTINAVENGTFTVKKTNSTGAAVTNGSYVADGTALWVQLVTNEGYKLGTDSTGASLAKTASTTTSITYQGTTAAVTAAKTIGATTTAITQHTLTLSGNPNVTGFTVSYTKNETAVNNATYSSAITFDENAAVTVTATLADGTTMYSWTKNSGTPVITTNATQTFAADTLTSNTTLDAFAYGELIVNDYDLDNFAMARSNTAITTTVTKIAKKNKSTFAGVTNLQANLLFLDESGNVAYTIDAGTKAFDAAVAPKVEFDNIVLSLASGEGLTDISSYANGSYDLAVEVWGLDSSDNRIARGYNKVANRTLTITDTFAGVLSSLTARLSLTSDFALNATDDAGANLEFEKGDKLTLNGFCNNGNVQAGDIAATSATKYVYKYYYTRNDGEPVLITTKTDSKPNAVKVVTSTTATFTIPDGFDQDDELSFYVTITGYDGDTPITTECSSKETGTIDGWVNAPHPHAPSFAEGGLNGYVYFYNLDVEKDNNLGHNTEAWSAVELTSATTVGSTIGLGTYYEGQAHRVFIPDSAVCTGDHAGKYLVWNARDSETTFNTTSTKGTGVTIAAGNYGYVSANSKYMWFGSSNTAAPLTIYTSSTEEYIYINSDELTTGADGATPIGVGYDKLTRALSLDGSKENKGDALVNSTHITAVQRDGTVDVIDMGKTKVKGRGNTTWRGTNKKSWNITFKAKNFTINGMTGTKFSLLANFQDPSLARVRFMHDLSDSVGIPYAADARFCDVFMDGLYVGSFTITQKNDTLQDLNDSYKKFIYNEGGTELLQDIDFMIELACESQGDEFEFEPNLGFASDHNGIISVTIPDGEDVLADIADGKFTVEQQGAIANYISDKYEELFEVINDPDSTKEEIEAVIDLDSLAKFYLIQELAKNYDAGVSSFYLVYKASLGKFQASPVWDFDNSLGNLNVSPESAPDYMQTSGWWCKYWKGNGDNYDGNLIHAAANNKAVMQAAKKAWFGTSKNDKTSFIYNIQKFAEDTSTPAALTQDNGVVNRDYYESVLESSADNNYLKWYIRPGDWVYNHNQLRFYSMDYDSFFGMVDYETYDVKTGVSKNSTAFENALQKTIHSYSENYFTTTESLNGGQYDYAADYMISRAAWLTYYLVAGDVYYLTGTNFGGFSSSETEFKLIETGTGTGIYSIRDVDRSFLLNSFKLNNGTNYLGPSGSDLVINTQLRDTSIVDSSTNLYGGRAAYTNSSSASTGSSGSVVKDGNNAFTIGAATLSSEDNVNIYYKPSTGKIWIAAFVNDVITAPTSVSITSDSGSVLEGEYVTLTASATGAQTNIDGAGTTDYTGNLVYKFYASSDATLAPAGDELVGTVTTPNTENVTTEASVVGTTYFYFVVSLESYSDASTQSTSTTVDNNLLSQTLSGVDVYVDFGDVDIATDYTGGAELGVLDLTVGNDPVFNTLTRQGTSNIYKATVTAHYYETSSGQKIDNFYISSIKVNDGIEDTEISITNAAQPSINKYYNTHTIWLKCDVDSLSSNVVSGAYEVDDDLTTSIDEANLTSTDTQSYSTKRIYFAKYTDWSSGDSYDWKNIYAYYWGGGVGGNWANADSIVQFTHCYTNTETGQYVYYADIPKAATGVIVTGSQGNYGAEYCSENKYFRTPDLNVASVSDNANNSWAMVGHGSNSGSNSVDGEGRQNVAQYNSTAPTITKYYTAASMSNAGKFNITPPGYNGGAKYTGYNSEHISINSSGVVTAVNGYSGSETVTMTVKGSNGDTAKFGASTSVTTTLTIVDKADLNNLLANGEVIISNQESGTYTTHSYNLFMKAYRNALATYKTSFVQEDINAAVDSMEEAIANIYGAVPEDDAEFSRISYRTGITTVEADNTTFGSVEAPTAGIVDTASKGYTVTYAVDDGTGEFTFAPTSTATANEGYSFREWKNSSSVQVADTATFTIPVIEGDDSAAAPLTATYTAYFNVVLHYQFYDYNKTGPFNEEAVDEIEDFDFENDTDNYFTFVDYTVDTPVDGSVVANYTSLLRANCPTIQSDYMTYNFVSNTTEGIPNDAQPIAHITATPKSYSFALYNADLSKQVNIGRNGYYQSYYSLDAYRHAEVDRKTVASDSIYWKLVVNNKDVAVVQSQTFSFNIVDPTSTKLYVASDVDTINAAGPAVGGDKLSYVDGDVYSSYISNVGFEGGKTDDGRNTLTQNFYIVNKVPTANKENFVGGGVVYASFTTGGTNPLESITAEGIAALVTSGKTYADGTGNKSVKATINSKAVSIRYDKGTAKYAYSEVLQAYQRIFGLQFENKLANSTKSVAMLSYYVYNDGTVYISSVTTASMYEASAITS